MLERTRRNNKTETTFVLPADHPDGEVSVVGDFNDWHPGAHWLTGRGDGARGVSVTLPADRRVHFRYLAENAYWFDEDGADGHDGTNSYLHPQTAHTAHTTGAGSHHPRTGPNRGPVHRRPSEPVADSSARGCLGWSVRVAAIAR